MAQNSPLTVPTPPREVRITNVFQDGVELNWLPPTEPNGEVLHYVIYYTPEGGTEQNSSTGSNLTHYNLTGLERNRVYTNIAVQAVNSAGRSDRSAVIAQYIHILPGESWNMTACIMKNTIYHGTKYHNVILFKCNKVYLSSPRVRCQLSLLWK